MRCTAKICYLPICEWDRNLFKCAKRAFTCAAVCTRHQTKPFLEKVYFVCGAISCAQSLPIYQLFQFDTSSDDIGQLYARNCLLLSPAKASSSASFAAASIARTFFFCCLFKFMNGFCCLFVVVIVVWFCFCGVIYLLFHLTYVTIEHSPVEYCLLIIYFFCTA